MKPLQQFVLDEMTRRGMSAREFGKFAGISSTSVNGYVNGDDTEPSLGSLRKLAKTTAMPLAAIIAMAYPEVAIELDIDPKALLLARELSQLSQAEFDLIERLIRSAKGIKFVSEDAKQK